jgi:hypothetical protein
MKPPCRRGHLWWPDCCTECVAATTVRRFQRCATGQPLWRRPNAWPVVEPAWLRTALTSSSSAASASRHAATLNKRRTPAPPALDRSACVGVFSSRIAMRSTLCSVLDGGNKVLPTPVCSRALFTRACAQPSASLGMVNRRLRDAPCGLELDPQRRLSGRQLSQPKRPR